MSRLPIPRPGTSARPLSELWRSECFVCSRQFLVHNTADLKACLARLGFDAAEHVGVEAE